MACSHVTSPAYSRYSNHDLSQHSQVDSGHGRRGRSLTDCQGLYGSRTFSTRSGVCSHVCIWPEVKYGCIWTRGNVASPQWQVVGLHDAATVITAAINGHAAIALEVGMLLPIFSFWHINFKWPYLCQEIKLRHVWWQNHDLYWIFI